MTFNATAVNSLFDELVSHAMTLGLFDRVASHEPKNAPGNGLSCVFWVQSITPAAMASGLAAVTSRVQVNARIYSPMLQEPQDAIDPNITTAVATLLEAYSGDFNLGGTVRNIDLLGQHGTALSATAGYIQQDNRMFRVMEITIPVIINDTFEEVA